MTVDGVVGFSGVGMAGSQAIAAGGGVHADPVAELNHILYRLDRLTDAAWEQHSAAVEDFVLILEQVNRRVSYLQTKILNVAEADAAWALNGFRSTASWLSSQTGGTRAQASKMVKTARAMRDHLPEAAQALASGRISAEHGHILAREATKTQALRQQLRSAELGEGFLVDSAATMGAGEFSKVAKHWAAMADPAAADRNWREESEKDEVFLSPTMGGYHLSGWLNPLSGKAIEEALEASMGRKKQGDERPPAQRRAAALVELAHGWLDSGELLPGARIRPHLTVTVPLPTLHALCEASGSAIPPQGGVTPEVSARQTLFAAGGPRKEGSGLAFQGRAGTGEEIDPAQWVEGWSGGDGHIISTAIDFAKLVGKEPASLEDGTVIPPSVLSRLACDSKLMRVVFGPESTILDAGREKRIFPANQTRAIIARDRHCQFPNCDEPPGYGEIHHSIWWWKYGGTTSVDQGILLCWFHHGYVHDQQVTIMRRQGKWIFADRWGFTIRKASSKETSPAREQDSGRFPPAGTEGQPNVAANIPKVQPKTEECSDSCYHPTAEEMAYYGIPDPEDDPWGRDIHQLWEECGPRPQPPRPEWDSCESWE